MRWPAMPERALQGAQDWVGVKGVLGNAPSARRQLGRASVHQIEAISVNAALKFSKIQRATRSIGDQGAGVSRMRRMEKPKVLAWWLSPYLANQVWMLVW